MIYLTSNLVHFICELTPFFEMDLHFEWPDTLTSESGENCRNTVAMLSRAVTEYGSLVMVSFNLPPSRRPR